MGVLGRVPRWLLSTWRQSLKARVAVTTMLLGAVVVGLLGSYLYSEIAGGLERERIRVAQNEALTLTAQAQQQWDAENATDVAKLNIDAKDIVERLKQPGPEPVALRHHVAVGDELEHDGPRQPRVRRRRAVSGVT